MTGAAGLAGKMTPAPPGSDEAPDPAKLLFGLEEPPPFPKDNIFPITWETETPRLLDFYEKGRDPGWSPATLPWDTLDPAAFTWDQR